MKRFPEQPWMKPREIEVILSRLRPDMRMIEYGAGGSTVRFAPLVAYYGSIEHDRAWHQRLVRHLTGRGGYDGLDCRLVPVGLPAFHGARYPAGYQEAFGPYVRELLNMPVPDAVLVDGRSRREAGSLAIKRLKPGGLLFFHDYECPSRGRYRGFAGDLEPEVIVDSLAVFRAPKKSLSNHE